MLRCAAISCSATTGPLADANGVAASVVVQTVTVPGETPELLALAAASDLIAGVVGWTDLTAPDIADRIAALKEQPGGGKLVGLRHQVQSEPDPDWLTRPDVLRGLAAVARAGLVYDLVITAGQLGCLGPGRSRGAGSGLRPGPPRQAAHRRGPHRAVGAGPARPGCATEHRRPSCPAW